LSSIYGGFEELIYTSDVGESLPDCVGITTRLNPIIDPSNINIRGTGSRNLYDILLGMRQIQFSIDILPSNIDFIKDYQDGQTGPDYLHYANKTLNTGITFVYPFFNRLSVESRHNEAISATIEIWAQDLIDPADTPMDPIEDWPAAPSLVTPYRWLDSELTLGVVPETAWWSWRYEANNNLQLLGNVEDGGIRAVKARHTEVSGLIIKDMASFSEWKELMDGTVGPDTLEPPAGVHDSPEESKFNIKIEVYGSGGPQDPPRSGSAVSLLDNLCRWGRIEAPTGAEDLQAKRFPFTARGLG